MFGSDDEDGDPINGDPTNGEVDNGDNGDNGDPTNGEVDNGDNGDNGDIETGLLAEFARLSTLDNYTISMTMGNKFENIDVKLKYYEEFVYMVDFFNSHMKFIFDYAGESLIQDLEDQIKAEYGQKAVDIMDFWAEKIIYPNALIVNPYHSMLLYDDIALFVDDMFTEDGDTFTLDASKFDDYTLNIFIWNVMALNVMTIFPMTLEAYLTSWFEDTDVEFPGLDPDDLRTAFAQVFAAEHDEMLGTLISHEITVTNNDITVNYVFDADGFAFTLTMVYEAFDTTTINTEQDLSYLKALQDVSIVGPMLLDLFDLDVYAGVYCEQESVDCDIDDILTIDEIGPIIDEFGFLRIDGDFLIEIIGEDHYRIAYETQVDSITYRFVGDASVIEEAFTMGEFIKMLSWFVKEGDTGFDDYDIDFVTPALPPTDTNPNP